VMKHGFSFLCLFSVVQHAYFVIGCMFCFCCVRFSFSVLSREIGWQERLRHDLFCVGCDSVNELMCSGVDYVDNWSVGVVTRR